MYSTPILEIPNFTKTLVLECDALGHDIGKILMQQGMPLAFASNQLKVKN